MTWRPSDEGEHCAKSAARAGLAANQSGETLPSGDQDGYHQAVQSFEKGIGHFVATRFPKSFLGTPTVGALPPFHPSPFQQAALHFCRPNGELEVETHALTVPSL